MSQATIKNALRSDVRKLPAPSWSVQSSGSVTSPATVFQNGGVQRIQITSLPPAEWYDPEYRQAYMETAIDQGIAWQIRVNREERGWTQVQLAKAIGTGQSAISKLEDPESGDVRLRTLVKVANAFDCALVVRLAPYSELAALSQDLTPERLFACPFSDEYDQTRAINGP